MGLHVWMNTHGTGGNVLDSDSKRRTDIDYYVQDIRIYKWQTWRNQYGAGTLDRLSVISISKKRGHPGSLRLNTFALCLEVFEVENSASQVFVV